MEDNEKLSAELRKIAEEIVDEICGGLKEKLDEKSKAMSDAIMPLVREVFVQAYVAGGEDMYNVFMKSAKVGETE